jgi:phytoene dehydrogenase-like protein
VVLPLLAGEQSFKLREEVTKCNAMTAAPSHPRVVVIGGGIGGLTAAALLAHRGYEVMAFDQALVPGGCASTFRRRGFTFDVGATQVAGLEPGGVHHQIFQALDLPLPEATPCDPACAVYLPGESEPICVWRDPDRWRAERQRQFPGSEPFWQLLATLFQASWRFQGREPVLPPRNGWDLWQLVNSVRPDTLVTVPFTFATVGQALQLLGLGGDRRLKTFLDLQLKLYSQVGADDTALLYAATALGVSQAPLGLCHLQGSMQVLSDRLVAALERDGGKLLMRHTVERIVVEQGRPTGVVVRNQKTGQTWTEPADHVVANVTVQNLVQLLGEDAPQGLCPPGAIAAPGVGGVCGVSGGRRPRHPRRLPAPPPVSLRRGWPHWGKQLLVCVRQPPRRWAGTHGSGHHCRLFLHGSGRLGKGRLRSAEASLHRPGDRPSGGVF